MGQHGQHDRERVAAGSRQPSTNGGGGGEDGGGSSVERDVENKMGWKTLEARASREEGREVGRVIPCDFIGIVKSQQPIYLKGGAVTNHDELMSNFFTEPDTLAYEKVSHVMFQTRQQLLGENVPNHRIPHKTFSGNHPSLSLLLPSLSAYNIGQLLAIYEHRIAVEDFIRGINSFDQWGVELGKSLATQVRKQLNLSRTKGEPVVGFNFSTSTLLTRYLEADSGVQSNSTMLPKM
ncbi:glucose-6-phosphate isomerase, cytosolic 2B-like [Elaeis guineensis]|uniref:Glucose-6-phosphate isomerase n=1 Tax=Elaeis guineensis var. tenera TaxID=51953 RepID=A0A6J0PPQ0_ELAGV|nr:glucose-6-phosphate isomerase, cytosolic 2B-like [Elaeis guineensis]